MGRVIGYFSNFNQNFVSMNRLKMGIKLAFSLLFLGYGTAANAVDLRSTANLLNVAPKKEYSLISQAKVITPKRILPSWYFMVSGSVPVGEPKLGKWAAGVNIGKEKKVLKIFTLYLEAGWIRLFPKSFVNGSTTFNTREINEFSFQIGPKLPSIKGIRPGILWGAHFAMQDGNSRMNGNYQDVFNNFTAQLQFKLLKKALPKSPLSLLFFYSHFRSNGDNLNYGGLKLRVSLR